MTPLSQDSAEVLALEALSWLVGHDELLPVFLGATGAGEGDIRTRAKDPEFLASVMDFLLMDDAWIADVLTYVRNEWGNQGREVTTEEVAAMREKLKSRTLPYQAAELLKEHPLR